MSRPPGYDHLSDDELAALIDEAIQEREQQFRDECDAERRPFLGRRYVLRQPRHASPDTREPRFGINPRVACRDKWRRIERLQFNKQWLIDTTPPATAGAPAIALPSSRPAPISCASATA